MPFIMAERNAHRRPAVRAGSRVSCSQPGECRDVEDEAIPDLRRTGLTARLAVQAAKAQDLQPILAGRDAARTQAVAAQHGFEWPDAD
jgi:hypothetical protein